MVARRRWSSQPVCLCQRPRPTALVRCVVTRFGTGDKRRRSAGVLACELMWRHAASESVRSAPPRLLAPGRLRYTDRPNSHRRLQVNNRRSPATKGRPRLVEGNHVRVFLEGRMNCSPKIPDALAVHDTHPEDSARPTLLKVIEHDILHVLRTKRVQVEQPIDRKFDRRARI